MWGRVRFLSAAGRASGSEQYDTLHGRVSMRIMITVRAWKQARDLSSSFYKVKNIWPPSVKYLNPAELDIIGTGSVRYFGP